MGVHDRDWWRERYDARHDRGKHPATAERASPRRRSDQGVLRLATLAVLGIAILLLCLHKAHVF